MKTPNSVLTVATFPLGGYNNKVSGRIKIHRPIQGYILVKVHSRDVKEYKKTRVKEYEFNRDARKEGAMATMRGTR